MSEKHYEIADCPECGKRDFIDKDEKQWVCLKCGFSKDISKPEPEPSPGIGGMWLLVLLTILIWMMLTQYGSDNQGRQERRGLIENYFSSPTPSLNE